MFGFCALASGSKGNCVYLGSKKTKILIDAGVSTRAISQRLAQLQVNLKDIDAIVITHDHLDHIQGLKVLIKKIDVPIFCNLETAKGIMESLKTKPRFKIFTTGEIFEFQDLKLHPFSVQHDTLDPVGLTIHFDQLKLGFCTDLGFITSLVLKRLEACDYLYLEANHQPSMVYSSLRPDFYKQRVLSRQGHLSNEDCAKLIENIFHPKLKHVQLAHLSKECNSEEVAFKVVTDFLAKKKLKVDLSIASSDKISKQVYF